MPLNARSLYNPAIVCCLSMQEISACDRCKLELWVDEGFWCITQNVQGERLGLITAFWYVTRNSAHRWYFAIQTGLTQFAYSSHSTNVIHTFRYMPWCRWKRETQSPCLPTDFKFRSKAQLGTKYFGRARDRDPRKLNISWVALIGFLSMEWQRMRAKNAFLCSLWWGRGTSLSYYSKHAKRPKHCFLYIAAVDPRALWTMVRNKNSTVSQKAVLF